MPVPIRSIKFWLNAFIPRTIDGYTRQVPNAPPGETQIPGPLELNNSTEPLDDDAYALNPEAMPPIARQFGYHTDQRDFSNDIGASSRAHSEFKASLNGAVASIEPAPKGYHRCDQTIAYDLVTGKTAKTGYGSTDGMRFTAITSAPDHFVVELRGRTSNPLVIGSSLAPITYAASIVVSRATRSLEADIYIGPFPAFEAYATINDGAGYMLVREMPAKGSTVLGLVQPFAADATRMGESYARHFRVVVTDSDGDGTFDRREATRVPFELPTPDVGIPTP